MSAMSSPDWMPTCKPAPWPKVSSQRLPGSGQTLYHGALICVDSAGKFVKGIGTDPTLVAYGFLEHRADDGVANNSADAFSGEVLVYSDVRLVTFSGTALTDAHEGASAFIVDDQTMSITSNSGTRPIGGQIVEVVSATSAYVHVHPVLSVLLAARVAAGSAQATIPVPFGGAMLAAGTPMAAFADNASSNPGVTLANSKAVALRWNNNGTQTAVWLPSIPMPQDLDDAADIVIHALASKSGATVGDATTFTFAAFFQTAAALHDADTDCGGASSALTGDATAKTVAEVTRTIAAADVPAAPCVLSLSVKPTDGTLGTDDAMIHAIWIEYTRKPLTY